MVKRNISYRRTKYILMAYIWGRNMNRKLFGKKLNTARKDRGLTSEKLSEACGLNATYLRQIEAGTKMPSLPVFVLLCEKLEVSPSYLLSDLFPNRGIQKMDILLDLWERATPTQIKIVNAMVKSALDVLDE